MKKVAVLLLGAILLHALFRDFTALKIVLLLGGLILAYVLYEVPDRFMIGSKYPLVVLSLLAGVASSLYPALVRTYHLQQVFLLVSFYSLGLYLVTMESKGANPAKEIVALSLLMASASVNCYAAGQPLTILPLTLAATGLLFITGRGRLAPVTWLFCAAVLMAVYFNGAPSRTPGPPLSDLERYVLLGAAFATFLLSFVSFLRAGNTLKLLGFYAFLFLSLDVLLSLSARVPSTLLYYPLLAVLLIAPPMATLMKGSGSKA